MSENGFWQPVNGVDGEFPDRHFVSAVRDVIATMTGIEMNEVSESAGEGQFFTGQISGLMLLAGEKSAVISVSMSRETAVVLMAYMTGTPPFELKDGDLYDGAAELVNMIAGQTKALLAGTGYHFQLTFPFTVVGENHYIVTKNRVAQINRKFSTPGLEIYLKVFYV